MRTSSRSISGCVGSPREVLRGFCCQLLTKRHALTPVPAISLKILHPVAAISPGPATCHRAWEISDKVLRHFPRMHRLLHVMLSSDLLHVVRCDRRGEGTCTFEQENPTPCPTARSSWTMILLDFGNSRTILGGRRFGIPLGLTALCCASLSRPPFTELHHCRC